jgi:uncharacterized protein
MIDRIHTANLESHFFKGKAIILLGARQTGKTTLVRHIIDTTGEKAIYINCDEPAAQSVFENISSDKWKQLIGNNKIIVVDEAQRIKDIGIKLKPAIDNLRDIQLIVTGSSSLDLSNVINEPLTGRKLEYLLYPISWGELKGYSDYLERKQRFEARLVFGMYPEIITNPGREPELLNNLAGSYLYKDILFFGGIRKPEILHKLLRALALQIGNEVSYNELSRLIGIDKNTVMNYISLLEKTFIIFRLDPLSRNLRNEISTSRKIYFWDNGIRNSLIANFNSVNLRTDSGALWENFLMSERLKSNHYNMQFTNTFFWRTSDRKEIDLIEESGGKFNAFEFKWSGKKSKKLPSVFLNTYPVGEFKTITRDNFEDFL